MNSELSLDNVMWEKFRIGELFAVEKGEYLPGTEIIPGNVPYITAKSTNNGCTDFINNSSLFKKNSITIEKINFTAYYQPHDFYCSHDVSVISHEKLNKYNGIFIANMITRQGKKYSYGLQAQKNVVKRESILLPIDNAGYPYWEFMEEYMKKVENKLLEKEIIYFKNKLTDKEKEVKAPNEIEWNEFFLKDIFDEIQRGKRLTKANQIIGKTPYVSSSGFDNGVDNFIGNELNIRKFDNCLTIANSGSVGKTFYHQYEFIASDHVTILKNKMLSKYQYLFLSAIIERLSEKYSFNREINNSRLLKEKILLPIKDDKTPDWIYMENYIKMIENEQTLNWLNAKMDMFQVLGK
ncbi:type I restriction modification DNA specificity protein [Tissierella praeacuta]|uniref:restriction endonuclease subunit S n=1 Tax=Tissierella praeacuta TaxID=43131 RepID=UPI00104327FB|nr:restriction endonuclease subunit S [Tissierella praeacuta]TCU74213.1 type I restriction modification DNA specificity protein [Tissierella praeacuta]